MSKLINIAYKLPFTKPFKNFNYFQDKNFERYSVFYSIRVGQKNH
jgi:hypothetical protein